MEADRTEMHDLSGELPRRTADMKRAWESWARRTGVQFQPSFSYYQMLEEYEKSLEHEPQSG
jgi:predicted DNA-binding protein (UPF0278 family)